MRRAALCWWLVAGGLVATPAVAAPDATAPLLESKSRTGFFMRLAPNLSYLWLSSNANVLTDFRQEIPSTAYAPGYGFEYQIGREVWRRVSLAAALSFGTFRSVRARVADQVVSMQDFQVSFASLGLAVTALPFEDLGWSTALGVGLCGFGASNDDSWFLGDKYSGEPSGGPCVSGTGGYEWQVSRAWWLGLGARLFYAQGAPKARAPGFHALSPGLVVTATYY